MNTSTITAVILTLVKEGADHETEGNCSYDVKQQEKEEQRRLTVVQNLALLSD